MFTVATIYIIACIFTIMFAAPVALLAPVLFAVTLPAMTGDEGPPPPAPAALAVAAPHNTAAPFVAVYAARGQSRPTVHAWSLCADRPFACPVSRKGMPLKGAARASKIARQTSTHCRMGG